MASVRFLSALSFDARSAVAAANFLAPLGLPAQPYAVVANTPLSWLLDLDDIAGGVDRIEFRPAQGEAFAPGAGNAPPLAWWTRFSFTTAPASSWARSPGLPRSASTLAH
jgi:hypothetical protein